MNLQRHAGSGNHAEHERRGIQPPRPRLLHEGNRDRRKQADNREQAQQPTIVGCHLTNVHAYCFPARPLLLAQACVHGNGWQGKEGDQQKHFQCDGRRSKARPHRATHGFSVTQRSGKGLLRLFFGNLSIRNGTHRLQYPFSIKERVDRHADARRYVRAPETFQGKGVLHSVHYENSRAHVGVAENAAAPQSVCFYSDTILTRHGGSLSLPLIRANCGLCLMRCPEKILKTHIKNYERGLKHGFG